MNIMVIEDERHAERHGEYRSMSDALVELRRLSTIPWDHRPNVAPCMSWKTCGRKYEVAEYDDQVRPWKELRRYAALDISASGVFWSDDLPELDQELDRE